MTLVYVPITRKEEGKEGIDERLISVNKYLCNNLKRRNVYVNHNSMLKNTMKMKYNLNFSEIIS